MCSSPVAAPHGRLTIRRSKRCVTSLVQHVLWSSRSTLVIEVDKKGTLAHLHTTLNKSRDEKLVKRRAPHRRVQSPSTSPHQKAVQQFGDRTLMRVIAQNMIVDGGPEISHPAHADEQSGMILHAGWYLPQTCSSSVSKHLQCTHTSQVDRPLWINRDRGSNPSTPRPKSEWSSAFTESRSDCLGIGSAILPLTAAVGFACSVSGLSQCPTN